MATLFYVSDKLTCPIMAASLQTREISTNILQIIVEFESELQTKVLGM